MEDEDDMDIWSGNQNRRLWKTACTRAALSVRFFPNRMLLSLETLSSPPSLIKSGYYMQPSHLHHKPQTYSNWPVEHGKTISGRKSA